MKIISMIYKNSQSFQRRKIEKIEKIEKNRKN